MKNTIAIIISLLAFISCKAQNIIPLNIDQPNDSYNNSRIKYYKDIDNDLDPYIGSWKWEEGNNSFTIIFNKIVNHKETEFIYSDLLVGEYKYIEDGVVLINSIPSTLLNDINGIPIIVNDDNSVFSSFLTANDGGFPPCPECPPNALHIILGFGDKTRPNVVGRMSMVRFIDNGIEKIRVRINKTDVYNFTDDYIGYTNLTVPDDSVFTLVRIN